MGFPALTQANIDKIQIDEGYVVLDYGLSTELALGPTRGGGEFSVDQTIRSIDFDGKKVQPRDWMPLRKSLPN